MGHSRHEICFGAREWRDPAERERRRNDSYVCEYHLYTTW